MAQLVKNMPAMQETWVRSLGWEDPLEEGTVTLSSILALDRGTWLAMVHRVTKSQTELKRLSLHACMHALIHHFIILALEYLTEKKFFFLLKP